MLDAGAGKTVLIDQPGTYVTGKLSPKSGTTIEFVAGVELTKKLNAVSVLDFRSVSDVTINARGGKIYGDDLPGANKFSHTVQFIGAKRVTINDLHVIGGAAGGDGKDAYYLGSDASGPCEDIHIVGGSATYAKRNNISVTAAKRTRLIGVELAYAVSGSAPGAGCDIEANGYGDVEDTKLINCHIHHNYNAGFVMVLGPDAELIDCVVHDNGGKGVMVTSGTHAFKGNSPRPYKEYWGIGGFDTATGVITLGGDLADLPVGTSVGFATRNGATIPAEFSAPRFVVSRHVGEHGIVLGAAERFNEITSTVSGFTGSNDADPALSDVYLKAYVAGQVDRLTVRNTKIYNNGDTGFDMVGSGTYDIDGCEVYDNAGAQIAAKYTKNVRIRRSEVYLTEPGEGYRAGIVANDGGGYLEITEMNVHDMTGNGIQWGNWTDAVVEDNTVHNCGSATPGSNPSNIFGQASLGHSVKRNRVSQEPDNVTTLYGLNLLGTAVSGSVTDNDCTGAGTTNANSIKVSSGTNEIARNKRRDGAVVP